MPATPSNSQGFGALLFVDIDGVLHRRDGPWFERLGILTEWLDENPKVCMVLSSSHREYSGLQRLRDALPAPLQSRLIGQTPRIAQGRLDPPVRHVRQREIEAYLRESTTSPVPFVALDDDVALFSPNWEHLVCTDARTGLTQEVLGAVLRALRGFGFKD